MARRVCAAAGLSGPRLLPAMVAKSRLILGRQEWRRKNSPQVWTGRGLTSKLCQFRRTVTSRSRLDPPQGWKLGLSEMLATPTPGTQSSRAHTYQHFQTQTLHTCIYTPSTRSSTMYTALQHTVHTPHSHVATPPSQMEGSVGLPAAPSLHQDLHGLPEESVQSSRGLSHLVLFVSERALCVSDEIVCV